MEKEMVSEVKSYKCNWCDKLYRYETNACGCAYDHAKYYYANSLLRENFDLQHINRMCGFNWDLTKEQENITQNNCFIISHWQCCDKPAYRIVEINVWGSLKLWGRGGWGGYYGDYISIDRLPKPYPQEDLFIYGENKV